MSRFLHFLYVRSAAMLLVLLFDYKSQGLNVSILVNYTPPPGSILGPNEYRAASGPVNVTCVAQGTNETVRYQWSSTCRNCPFQFSKTSSIVRAAVHSGDTGNHSCTATVGGTNGTADITFRVVGIGIHAFNGAELTIGSLPNNSMIVSHNPENGFYFRFFCRSDSMMENVGRLIALDGISNITKNTFFEVANPQPGELRVQSTIGTHTLLQCGEQGVYTCRIPLQSGGVQEFSIGIYPIGFSTPPTIVSDLVFNSGFSSSTLTCISTGSPATTVTWLRDGQPLTIDGSLYQLTQTIVNRRQSMYKNVLKLEGHISSGTYTCIVSNAISSASKELEISTDSLDAGIVTISTRGTPIALAGKTFSLVCTVSLADENLQVEPVIQWMGPLDINNGNDITIANTTQEDSNHSVYSRILQFKTTLNTSHAGQYMCKATTENMTATKNTTITVLIPTPRLVIERDPAANVALYQGDNLTVTCIIQLDPAVDSDTMVNGALSGPRGNASDLVMLSQGKFAITLTVDFLMASTSAYDVYTCSATVIPASNVMDVTKSVQGSCTLGIFVFSPHFAVNITVEYTPPPGFVAGPSEYRAASGPVRITCSVQGINRAVGYHWSSTCRDCRFKSSTSPTVYRGAAHSGDTGIHTCTVFIDEVMQNATIPFKVVGVGIHAFNGAKRTIGSHPNNSMIVSNKRKGSEFYFRFFCRSDSMMGNVGELIGLDGLTIVTNNTFFEVANPQPGELRVQSTVGIHTLLPHTEQGVYTCRIPLQSGEIQDFNIGIYPNRFNTPPTITDVILRVGSSSSYLTCISAGSPATTVAWMRDGQPLTIDGDVYQTVQTVTNRRKSMYENVLTLNSQSANTVIHNFTCKVTNRLGSKSRTFVPRFCKAETVVSSEGDEGIDIILHWPDTLIGQTVLANCTCGNNTIGHASRVCGMEAKWETTDDTACILTKTVKGICQLATLNNATISETLDKLGELTMEEEQIGVEGVILTTSFLEDLVSEVMQEQNETLIESFLVVVDNLLDVDPSQLQESQEMFNTSGRLLETVETVAEILPIPENESQTIIALTSFAVAVQEVQTDDIQEQFFSAVFVNERATIEADNLIFGIHPDATASITIPTSVIMKIPASINPNTSIRMTSSIYLTDQLFLRRNEKSQEIGSIIISTSLNTNNSIENLDPPVILTFIKNLEVQNDTNATCNFWDPTADSRFGDWSTRGCAVVNETKERVVCECDHLTNFAILLDISPWTNDTTTTPVGIKKTLEVLSFIGAVISICLLVLTIATYCSSKKLRSSQPSQILISLCFGLLGTYVAYILAFYITAVPELCILAGVLVQYFLLAIFFIMATDAVLLFIKICFVFVEIQRYVVVTTIISWSAPAIIVVATVLPDYNNFVGVNFCRPYGIQFYAGLLAPFLAIYVFNWIIYVIIIGFLIQRYCKSKTGGTNQGQLRQQLRNAIALSLLLGLGWALGLPATEGINNTAVRTTFQVLFIVVTAFQGLYIFIMQCLTGRNAVEARKEWWKWFSLITCHLCNFKTYSVNSTPVNNRKVLVRTPTNLTTLPFENFDNFEENSWERNTTFHPNTKPCNLSLEMENTNTECTAKIATTTPLCLSVRDGMET